LLLVGCWLQACLIFSPKEFKESKRKKRTTGKRKRSGGGGATTTLCSGSLSKKPSHEPHPRASASFKVCPPLGRLWEDEDARCTYPASGERRRAAVVFYRLRKRPPKEQWKILRTEDRLPQTIHQFGSQRSTEVTRGAYESPECPLQLTGS
jgi:hypothetical protein